MSFYIYFKTCFAVQRFCSNDIFIIIYCFFKISTVYIVVIFYHLRLISNIPGIHVPSFKLRYSRIIGQISEVSCIVAAWNYLIIYIYIDNFGSVSNSVVGGCAGNCIANSVPFGTCEVEETELGFVFTCSGSCSYRQTGVITIKFVNVKYSVVIVILIVDIENTISISVGCVWRCRNLPG